MRVILAILMAAALAGCQKKQGIEMTARELNPELKSTSPEELKADPAVLGLDLYPGAKTPKGMPPMIRSSVVDPERKMYVATVEVWLESSDSPDEIAAYYRQKLQEVDTTTSKTGVTVTGINGRGEKSQIIATRKAGAAMTTISLLVTKNPSG